MSERQPEQFGGLASDDVEQLLRNWLLMLHDMMELPLPALRQLIEAELRGKRRSQVLLRLHGRYNRLRALDEKRKLLKGETIWDEPKQQEAPAAADSKSDSSSSGHG